MKIVTCDKFGSNETNRATETKPALARALACCKQAMQNDMSSSSAEMILCGSSETCQLDSWELLVSAGSSGASDWIHDLCERPSFN